MHVFERKYSYTDSLIESVLQSRYNSKFFIIALIGVWLTCPRPIAMTMDRRSNRRNRLQHHNSDDQNASKLGFF